MPDRPILEGRIRKRVRCCGRGKRDHFPAIVQANGSFSCVRACSAERAEIDQPVAWIISRRWFGEDAAGCDGDDRRH